MLIWKQKCVLNTVAFWVEFFDFSIYSSFLKNVSAPLCGLTTHIIKLFQTVSKCHLEYEKNLVVQTFLRSILRTFFEEYIKNMGQ